MPRPLRDRLALVATTALALAACSSYGGAAGLPDAAPIADVFAGGTPARDATAGPTAAGDGAPSSAPFPAPHPPLPQLTNVMGGRVLTAPTVYLVFFPGYPYVAPLQDFAAKMTQASFWGAATSEYGVGPLQYGGTITLDGETPPATTSSTEIQAWIAAELASGKLGTPDPQGLYTVFYPETTTVTQPNPVVPTLAPLVSCAAFGAYHDFAALAPPDAGAAPDAGSTTGVAYAVVPTCSTTVDDLTSVVSHEWVEAATDPVDALGGAFSLTPPPGSAYFLVDADHVVWGLLGGSEAGDLCESEGLAYFKPADVGYAVQRTWSNARAAASHDPCAPDLPGNPYLNSAPVLPEMVTFSSSLTGTLVTRGITIAPGQSATIDVDLFSDVDTGGPWSVTAEDLIYKNYGSYGLPETLAFSWDRTSGANGDTLHLTITVTRGSVIGGAHAFLITSSLGSVRTVWPGLVVE